tara:strand:+ start:696 stop:947 length:252 start_codon:yes stop_codon:yes gene_type:complete
MFLIDFVDNNSEALYYLGRIIAIFIIGPILVFKGYKNHDNVLLLIGILLIIWDGIKVGLQIVKNYNKNENLLKPLDELKNIAN